MINVTDYLNKNPRVKRLIKDMVMLMIFQESYYLERYISDARGSIKLGATQAELLRQVNADLAVGDNEPFTCIYWFDEVEPFGVTEETLVFKLRGLNFYYSYQQKISED